MTFSGFLSENAQNCPKYKKITFFFTFFRKSVWYRLFVNFAELVYPFHISILRGSRNKWKLGAAFPAEAILKFDCVHHSRLRVSPDTPPPHTHLGLSHNYSPNIYRRYCLTLLLHLSQRYRSPPGHGEFDAFKAHTLLIQLTQISRSSPTPPPRARWVRCIRGPLPITAKQSYFSWSKDNGHHQVFFH